MITTEGIKIDIEYDGWYWHQDKKRDYARDYILKKKGYKIIRIRSGKLLPSLQELQEAIKEVSKSDVSFVQIFLKDWLRREELNNKKQIEKNKKF